MLIGVSGKAKAGKDLLFSFAQKTGFEKLSFAFALKNIVRNDFKLTEEHVNGTFKDEPCERLDGHSPREALIDLGNTYRKYDSDYWVKSAMVFVEANPHTNYMITDVRFKNEAEAIKNHGGVLIRLERHPSRDSLVSQETKESLSEISLDSYTKWDFVLDAENNKSPEDLSTFWNVILGVLATNF